MSATGGSSSTTASEQWVTEAFGGPIERVRISPLYLLGLFVVAVAMALLPLAYVALIGLAGYGLYYHATENVTIMGGIEDIHGRISFLLWLWRPLVYTLPLVSGVILVVFMIKPLLARRVRIEKYIALVEEQEPALFAFVGRLCEVIGAPTPRRIDVDCEINAAASFRRGFASLLGHDLVLSIGAPLVAALTLRQFAGVLAHELGHFSQRLAMRLSYVIRSVNAWFARVVYDRDAWDRRMIQLSEDEDEAYIALAFLLARLFVWITRKVLWVLMVIGYMISCILMRQMEYNADRFQVRVAGSEAFKETLRRLLVLQLTSRAVHAELRESWKDGRLADDLPALLAARIEEIPKELGSFISDQLGQSRTGLFDTHPPEAVRIRRASKANAEGVFRAEEPASVLFSRFEPFCKEVTFSYYRDLIGPRLDRRNLISVDALVHRQREARRDKLTADHYFQGCLMPVRPLKIDRFSEVFKLPPKVCLTKLKQARKALQKSRAVIKEAYGRYADAETVIVSAQLAQTLFAAKADPRQYGLSFATPPDAKRALEQAEKKRQKTASELTKIESVVKLRAECALALLNVTQVANRLQDADKLRRRSKRLLDGLGCLQESSHSTKDLRREHQLLQAQAIVLTQEEPDEEVVHRVRRVLGEQHERLSGIRSLLAAYTYPFEHADGRVSMARYAIETIPPRDDPGRMLAVTEQTLDNIDSLYTRIMGELATIAERIEKALGLKPLETK